MQSTIFQPPAKPRRKNGRKNSGEKNENNVGQSEHKANPGVQPKRDERQKNLHSGSHGSGTLGGDGPQTTTRTADTTADTTAGTVAKSKRASEQEEIYAGFRPSSLHWRNIDWIVLIWMTAMHVGCLAAPFFFNWTALGVAVGLHWLTCSIGICLGYHRYLAHKSFKLKSPVEFCVLLCGAISGEGSPLMWSATHRLHHQRSDEDGDPHSPLEGKWWSHILWLFVGRTPEQMEKLYKRYVPELADRPMLRFFDKTYFLWLVAVGVGLFAIGGLPMLLWAVCVRMVFAYHSTWFVNSATHLWGYRNYDTRDESRNLWWVALLAYGEGWHNNHHAHPSVARAGHRWWEIDMTWYVIKLLKVCGLATDVREKLPNGRAAAATE